MEVEREYLKKIGIKWDGNSRASRVSRTNSSSIGYRSTMYFVKHLMFRYYVGNEQKQLLLDTIDKLYTDAPYLGTRKMVEELKLLDAIVGRKQVRSCYNTLNINAIYPNKRMTIAMPEHKNTLIFYVI